MVLDNRKINNAISLVNTILIFLKPHELVMLLLVIAIFSYYLITHNMININKDQ
jgi:hypothetical protein